MDTRTLAAGIAGFLLGGFVVSVAATLEDEGGSSDHGIGHGTVQVTAQSVTVPPLRQ
jgi:hypothetical protein